MALSTPLAADELGRIRGPAGPFVDTARSLAGAVSWGAIAAGAAAAASLSLILLILGVGLGLSSVSPWARDGVNAATFGLSTVLWLTLTQLLASAMGGYLAGRLRTKWTDVHTDEVYFRDTAHGFLAWAVASLVTAAMLGSAIGSILGQGAQAGATLGRGVVGAAGAAVGSTASAAGYTVDSLFRREAGTPAAAANPDPAAASDAAEVGRIFMNVGRLESLPQDDVRYVAQTVARRTGLSMPEAEKRVADVQARAQARLREAEAAARDTADKARKAFAYSALWLFVSLLVGAFVASLAATIGGRRRDA